MSVVYEPTNVHRCPVSFHYTDNGRGTIGLDHPAFWAQPGTVIACDCTRTFVACEPRIGETFARWRREGRIERWRRERRAR